MSHLYSFTLYWKNNVKEIVEIQIAHSMVYLITSMHESFYVMNIFLNYSHFIDNYISIFNIINEYIVTVAFDHTSYNNISANNDWSL